MLTRKGNECSISSFFNCFTQNCLFLQSIEKYRDERNWISQMDVVIKAWEDEKCEILRRMDALSVVIKGCKDRLH